MNSINHTGNDNMKTLTDITKTLETKIAAVNAKIAALPKFDEAEAKEAHEESLKMLNDISTFDPARFTELAEKSEIFGLRSDLERFETSLATPLTLVVTRYLITDGNLISPAGFGTDEKVFITNEVMIQSDIIPSDLEGLVCYDMNLI